MTRLTSRTSDPLEWRGHQVLEWGHLPIVKIQPANQYDDPVTVLYHHEDGLEFMQTDLLYSDEEELRLFGAACLKIAYDI